MDDFAFFNDLLIYFDILWCFDDVLRLFWVPTWSTENVPMVYHLSTKYGGTHLVWPCLPKKNRCNVVMIIMNHDHLSSVFINYDHLWSVLICFFWIIPLRSEYFGTISEGCFPGITTSGGKCQWPRKSTFTAMSNKTNKSMYIYIYQTWICI